MTVIKTFKQGDTSVETLAAAWSAFVGDYARTHAHAEIADPRGLALRWADSPFIFWNCVALTERDIDSEKLSRRLERAARYMGGKQQAGYVYIFENLLTPEAREALPLLAASAGLTHANTMYDMRAEQLAAAAPQDISIAFERVASAAQLRSYADINSEAHGLPLTAGRDGLEGSTLWLDEMCSYLGIVDGEPVSAAATCAVGDALFLDFVATRPGFQRRGYGEAVARAALREGARVTGLRTMVLHATTAGAPVYERIGFRTIGCLQAYTLANHPR